jgi:hypothetical protein
LKGIVKLWDVTSRQHLRSITNNDEAIFSLAFAPDGKSLAVAYEIGPVLLCDPFTGKPIRRIEAPVDKKQSLDEWDFFRASHINGQQVGAVTFSPDGKILGLGGTESTLLYRTATWKLLAHCTHAKGGSLSTRICSLAFSPGSRMVAAASPKTGLRLWELATGKERTQIGKDMPVSCIALSPGGRTLAVGCSDASVSLWDVLSGKQLSQLSGHRGQITSIAFSGDGKCLATGSADTTILLWDIPKEKMTEQELLPKELQTLWEDLAGDDAMKAYKAIWILVAAPNQSVPFLQKQLHPVPPADPKKLTHLVKDLGNDNFATRDKAARELKKLGVLARSTLEEALKQQPPLEVRMRIEGLLNRLEKHPPTLDELREIRALEVLEYIGNSEANKLVEQLTNGAPSALLTQDARETLQRVKKNK